MHRSHMMSGFDVPAAAKAVGTSAKVMGGLLSRLREHRAIREKAASFRATLGLDNQRGMSFRVACQHPLLQSGVPHPDDFEAFAHIIGSDLPRWDEVTPVDDDTTIATDFGDNFVLIGSPEAESFTRLVFGYERRTGGAEYAGGCLPLPFRWEEDPRLIRVKYKRFVGETGQSVQRPNWPIVDQRDGRNRSLFPRLNADNFISDDLLLISKIPNFTSIEAVQRSRFIVSVAGAHGTATRSIGLVLKDRKLLAELHDAVAMSPYFQILVKAGSITHDPSIGSVASEVSVVDIASLQFTDQELTDARSLLISRHPRWRSSVVASTNAWRRM